FAITTIERAKECRCDDFADNCSVAVHLIGGRAGIERRGRKDKGLKGIFLSLLCVLCALCVLCVQSPSSRHLGGSEIRV
ncbi:MAG: hypothetical protein M3176_12015, partial [Chloroflexota bacterium]|nr:hypothetical protein [Chloroflexota bacterium]